ncbi:RES domain-containing protein [Affinibrenneria salicis]|uniref:RES domain-containing protein n=1 Tax=Affinibrenneria salicis TaxID=2590031 RepID=A0A5J5G1X7_9GAMM|nr:RES domain-containing protein [Affinibrenneria salicis]KAA9000625.1 RES domain-containing protein [Affinibrenneria salicis]
MILYRLTKTVHAATAWSGYGASEYGGRWNHKGYPAVYVSGSIALAALEILVHVGKESILNSYSLFSIEIDDADIQLLDNAALPDDWRRDPAPVGTMDIGSGWLQAGDSVALIVPSRIVPHERNAIINPQHPSFGRYRASIRQMDFSFDSRLTR